jgi:hypothetical protein
MSNPWLVPQSGPQHQRFGQKSEGTVKFTESVRPAHATSIPATVQPLAI